MQFDITDLKSYNIESGNLYYSNTENAGLSTTGGIYKD